MADTKICRYCGNEIFKDAETCEYCGRYLYKKQKTQGLSCTKCNAPVNDDDNYCQYCGAVFNIVQDNTIIKKPVRHNISGIPYNIIILLTSFALSILITAFMTAGTDKSTGGIIIVFSIAFVAAEIIQYLYFIPSIIAIENNNPNVPLVYILNLLLGITGIGWFVAFGLALQKKD